MCVCRLVVFSLFVFNKARRAELGFHDGTTHTTNFVFPLKLYVLWLTWWVMKSIVKLGS